MEQLFRPIVGGALDARRGGGRRLPGRLPGLFQDLSAARTAPARRHDDLTGHAHPRTRALRARQPEPAYLPAEVQVGQYPDQDDADRPANHPEDETEDRRLLARTKHQEREPQHARQDDAGDEQPQDQPASPPASLEPLDALDEFLPRRPPHDPPPEAAAASLL